MFRKQLIDVCAKPVKNNNITLWSIKGFDVVGMCLYVFPFAMLS